MGYFFTSILMIFSVEYFLNIPFIVHVKKMLTVSKKSYQVVSSKRISDHWKERVILHYAIQLMKESLYLFAMLLLFFVLLIMASHLFDQLMTTEPNTTEILSLPMNWLWMTALCLFYLYFKNKLKGNHV